VLRIAQEMVVGALQPYRTERTHEGLRSSVDIAGWLPAGTGRLWPGVVAGVGVQPLLQRSGGPTQRLATRRHLHPFQFQILDGRPA
jgi:hypothetical protein